MKYPGQTEVIERKPFDIDDAKEQLSKYDGLFVELSDRANAVEVTDDKSAATATEMIGQLKKLRNRIEEKRKVIIKEPDSFVRSVNAFVKPTRDKLDSIIKILTVNKIDPFQEQKKIEIEQAEKEIRKAEAEAQERLDKMAKEKGVDPVKMPKMIVPKKVEPIRTADGTASVRMKWTFEIEDESKIPFCYLSVNISKIKKAIAAGVRNISGVRIFQKAKTIIRTN